MQSCYPERTPETLEFRWLSEWGLPRAVGGHDIPLRNTVESCDFASSRRSMGIGSREVNPPAMLRLGLIASQQGVPNQRAAPARLSRRRSMGIRGFCVCAWSFAKASRYCFRSYVVGL